MNMKANQADQAQLTGRTMSCDIAKSADYTKDVFWLVKYCVDGEELQKKLPIKLNGWKKWQMSFTVNECRVMQLERNNLNRAYTMLNI